MKLRLHYIPRTKAPPPAFSFSFPSLRRPRVYRLAKLVSRKWIYLGFSFLYWSMFMICNFSSLFFIKTKDEKYIIFFTFLFFLFGGKMAKQKNELGIEDYFIFLTFQTISKIKYSKISLLAVHTVLCIFEEDLKICKYDKAK